MDSYQYQPINLGRPSIRLLQLHKGYRSDDIQGHFISAWFDDPDSIMPYFALSYTWGYIDKVEEVTIDSARIRVTLNLHMALQHLRSEEEDQIFWIDALCINQENVHEKIHQIRQMGDIYKEAEKVVVWLGRGTKETDLVMDAMNRLRKTSLGWHTAEWKDKASGWVDESNEHCANLREHMELMLERPWFRRIWILQEVANARQATTVHCGNRFVSVTIFSQFPALIALNPAKHCQSVLDIMSGISRKESWWAQGQKLHTLLVKFRESEATDDRDKIYALLGISSDAHRSKILDPKCDKSSQQVIREAISFILSEKYPQLVDDVSFYQFIDWKLTKFLDNVEDLEGSVLTDAFKGAEKEFLKLLIETDTFRISSGGFHDRNSVYCAIQKEQPAFLKMLLDVYLCCFEIEISDSQTPLSLAIQTGNTRIIDLVLQAGAEIDGECLNGRTPLLVAIERNKINIVDLLLQRGAKYKAQSMDNSDLLSQESDRSGEPISSISTPKNQLPLSFAIEIGNCDIAKLLLDHGAELEDKDLLLALESGNDNMVESLDGYNRASHPKIRGMHLRLASDNRGMRLRLAAQLGNVQLIKAFIKKGLALESKDRIGQTPLILAAKYGHCEAIKLLLESGAKLQSDDSNSGSPLMAATTNGNKDAVELLLQRGANIEVGDWYSKTPLIAAIKNGDKELVKLLLQNGADFEKQNNYNQIPLIIAIENGNKEIVELLLQNGADFRRKDKYNQPTFLVVTQTRCHKIIESLLKGARILK
ncbi:hypothetical protein EAE96_002719 [Botrytis aclada]|nr:hypothetical protein EAE96_002719 [Botrytis aclada]